jgi:hypothetical protein
VFVGCCGSVGGCGGSVVKSTGRHLAAEDAVVPSSNPAPPQYPERGQDILRCIKKKSRGGRRPFLSEKKQNKKDWTSIWKLHAMVNL